ncbi:MAG: magnesium transporter [Dehalococcoidia bacterium]
MPEDPDAQDLLTDARGLIREAAWARLLTLVTALHPADLSDLLLELEPDERAALLPHIPTDVIGGLFEFTEDEEIRELVREIGIEALPAVLEEVEADVAADVIQQLPEREQAGTIESLDREEVTDLLQYEEESAGGLMTPDFVSFPASETVGGAIRSLRVLRPPSDRAYYLYVTGEGGRLLGTVSIRDLLVSDPETELSEITNRDVRSVPADTDQEEAARLLQRYGLMAAPVVSGTCQLLGVINADDVLEVLQEEATEDMFRMVGVGDEERIFSPVPMSVRRRLPWMLANTFTAFLAALTVGLFDETLAKATVLALFMPVVAGQGGNAGTQTATIAVRSIAIGDLDVADVLRACRKEIMVAIANGLAIGLVAGTLAYIWKGNLGLSVILGGALLLNVCAATMAGVLIPLGLKWVRVDPAVAANIFVTTVTDVMGFLFFLGLGALALSWIT